MRIVYYHLISDKAEPYFNGLRVSTTKFKGDLKKFLSGYKLITFENLKPENHHRGNLILTFDDGYRSNLEHSLEIMDELGVKATFFINSDPLMNHRLMWRDSLTLLNKKSKEEDKRDFLDCFGISQENGNDLLKGTKNLNPAKITTEIDRLWQLTFNQSQKSYLLENPLYLDKRAIRMLIEQGHEIGVHSHSHPNHAPLSLEEAIDDTLTCQQYIKDTFDYDPVSMSFPFGGQPKSNKYYQEVMSKTSIRYFCGINYKAMGNRGEGPVFERLGMEDGRSFWMSFYVRPAVRLLR